MAVGSYELVTIETFETFETFDDDLVARVATAAEHQALRDLENKTRAEGATEDEIARVLEIGVQHLRAGREKRLQLAKAWIERKLSAVLH